jgi:hypothetical protein
MYINRNFMSELNNKIKNALGQDLVLKIKALFNEHVVAAPVEEPTKLAAEVVLKDGSKITYEGEKLDIGVMVKMLNADGTTTELMDGEYTMADDSKLYVKGGLVEKIEPASTEVVEVPEMDMAARVAALELALTELKNKDKEKEMMMSRLEAIEKLSKSTHEGLKTSLSAIDAIIETPSSEPIAATPKVWSEMTKAEQVKFNRGKI